MSRWWPGCRKRLGAHQSLKRERERDSKREREREKERTSYSHEICIQNLPNTLQPPPACYRSLSGPSGPKCPGSVPGVSLGVSLGPFGPRAPECPKSVPRVKKVSRTLWEQSRDTSGTLFGHSGARGPKGPRDTPRDTPGPGGPRDSCSRPGRLQPTPIDYQKLATLPDPKEAQNKQREIWNSGLSGGSSSSGGFHSSIHMRGLRPHHF